MVSVLFTWVEFHGATIITDRWPTNRAFCEIAASFQVTVDYVS